MAAGGMIGVVGLCETERTFGDWRSASIDPKPREAVLKQLASKRHCIRNRHCIGRFGAHFKADVDRDYSHGDEGLWKLSQMNVKFPLDAGGEAWIVDLNVRCDGACIWLCYDVNARKAHRLSKKAKH